MRDLPILNGLIEVACWPELHGAAEFVALLQLSRHPGEIDSVDRH